MDRSLVRHVRLADIVLRDDDLLAEIDVLSNPDDITTTLE